MSGERTARRLAAILAADVVGYTGLMEQDEDGTFERVRAYRKELFEPEIERHHGRIFKLMGDGLLAEFGSVVDAVECAVQLQRGMAERNSSLADDRRIDIRIGINLGDVIVEAEDRHGDGVNIAARLQQLAEPGGICISGTVFDQVRAKLAFPYQFVGEQRVKNIAQPIRIYRVPLAADARPRLPRSRRQRVAAAAIVGLLLIAVVAAFAIRWLEPGSRSGASERPSIAVLPFVNMSNDPQQDYFSDGMTEDLITDLSQVAGLLVISRNSTFVYKGKVVPPEQVARELGVGYVLEGSVQRQGDQLRINAQLINGETSVHLWARRYDRTITDVFAVQDEITRNIVAELQVELSADDQSRVAHIETADVRAYDAFLQGWERYRRNTPQGHAEAIPYFERAIAFDPSYGRAHAALANTYYEINDSSWNDLLDQLGLDSKSVLERSRQQLDLALQHPTSTAYLLQGEWLRVAGRFDEAVTESERAVALDPSDSLALANLSNILTSAGRAQDGLDTIKSAIRIDPHYPAIYLHYLAKAEFGLGDFTRAAADWERAIARNPENTWWLPFLASAYGHLGRLSDAKAAIAKADAGFAGWAKTTVLLATALSYKDHADLDRLLDGLRKAGVPELPFDFDKRSSDRLDGQAIRALLFGHTVRAHDEKNEAFEAKRTADGAVTAVGPALSETGQSVIEGDRLCDLYPLAGRMCAAVFRNPTGSATQQNEYIFVWPWMVVTFSVID